MLLLASTLGLVMGHHGDPGEAAAIEEELLYNEPIYKSRVCREETVRWV